MLGCETDGEEKEQEMDAEKLIKGRRILIVDDEKDVLEQLVELLDMCKIDTASTFEEGKARLEDKVATYDVAILDIMGVRGFDLLAIAKEHKVPALMLTAHALTEESVKRSAEEGAAYFAPKDEMQDIVFFVADVIEATDKKQNPWQKWMNRLGGYYDKRFHGPRWREEEEEFWKERLRHLSGS
jgi:DNA-binding NtrC family response regulator